VSGEPAGRREVRVSVSDLLGHWGYPAIFVVVMLGNLGVPVPEESVLLLAGYLVWDGQLRLLPALCVGILSAVAGDNLGYWAARAYGRRAVTRYGHWILRTPERLDRVVRLVARYGAPAVFAARFVPGLRFLAGPVAGAIGLPPLPFVAANVAGAVLYVPLILGTGYALGYGVAGPLAPLGRAAGSAEHLVLALAALGALALLGRRSWHRRRAQPGRIP
jgi:membrane protein DedA with SNARE-associated domain